MKFARKFIENRRGIDREEPNLGRARERPPFPSYPSFTFDRLLDLGLGWAHGWEWLGVGPHGVGGGWDEHEDDGE
jgi:hypothetical protein